MTDDNVGQPEQRQTHLIAPQDEAEQRIMAQIREGEELLNNSNSIQSKAQLLAAKNGYEDWREYTRALLKRRIFDTDEQADKFAPQFDEYGYVGYTLRALQGHLHRDLSRLRRVYKQVEQGLFPIKVSQPPLSEDEGGKERGAVNTKLDALLAGQAAIRQDLSGLRQTVLARFDVSEQTIIAAVIERLDQDQLATVQTVLNAIEAELVPLGELEETLVAVQRTLAEIQQQGVDLPDSTLTGEEVERLSELVDAPKLDAKHKLKVTVPIIPVFLAL